MRLDTDTAFEDLTALIRRIGAKEKFWEPKPQIDFPLEIEVTQTNHPEITAHLFDYPFGLIGAYGRQCLLYIPYITSGRDYPKFHFMECSTIKQMRNGGRFERYIVTNKVSGLFSVYINNHYKQEVQLDVCMNCLSEHRGHRVSIFSVRNFDIKLFFKKCQPYFKTLPSGHDGNIPPNIYRNNWDAISATYRNSVRWCCEQCGVNLAERQNLLHTHHRDGVKTNTSTKNLIALCKLCHIEQFQHNHMSITEEEKAFILGMRRRNSENERKFKDMR